MGIGLPIEVVIFDLGRTLIYELGPWDGLFAQADVALWRVLRSAGVRLDRGEIYGNYETLFQLYYEQHRGDLNEPTTAAVLDELLRARGYRLPLEALREAMRAMFAVTQTNWLRDDDAIPTLESLKAAGYRLGMISNASDDDNTQALIDKAQCRGYFEYIVSSAAFGRRKPDPRIFAAALDHFDTPPSAAIMVGDDYNADIEGAHAAGMQGVWVTRHAREPRPTSSEVKAEAVIDALSELPALLQTH